MLNKFFFKCSVLAMAGLLSLLVTSCDDDDPKKTDETPPDLSFENIIDQQEISGTLSIKIDASDDQQIEKIDVYLDNALIKTLTQTPFEFELDSKTIDNGVHTLKLIAKDKAGNQKTHAIQVTVENVEEEEQTLLTIHVPGNYLGAAGGTKPSKGFVVLHNENWEAISSAEIVNGETLVLTTDNFGDGLFTVTELLVYESEWSSYLHATSYLDVSKGNWVLTNRHGVADPVKSVHVSFNNLSENFGYGINSNAGLSSSNNNIYIDASSPGSTELELTTSPGQLFVRQYFNDGHNKFKMYASDDIKDGGHYTVDLSVLDQADETHELVNDVFEFPVTDGVIHLYGLTEAQSTDEAYYLGHFQQGGDLITLQYPKPEVTPFVDYFSITQFSVGNDVAYNKSFGKYDAEPLQAQATVESSSPALQFISTSGQFDFFITHYTLEEGHGDWFVVGPPIVNRRFQAPALPESVEEELDFVTFENMAFDESMLVSDFHAIFNYAHLINLINSSDDGFTEAIDRIEEKNITLDLSGTGLTGRRAALTGRSSRAMLLKKGSPE